MVSSIYTLLGISTPSTIHAKLIFHDKCRLGVGEDVLLDNFPVMASCEGRPVSRVMASVKNYGQSQSQEFWPKSRVMACVKSARVLACVKSAGLCQELWLKSRLMAHVKSYVPCQELWLVKSYGQSQEIWSMSRVIAHAKL